MNNNNNYSKKKDLNTHVNENPHKQDIPSFFFLSDYLSFFYYYQLDMTSLYSWSATYSCICDNWITSEGLLAYNCSGRFLRDIPECVADDVQIM